MMSLIEGKVLGVNGKVDEVRGGGLYEVIVAQLQSFRHEAHARKLSKLESG